MDELEEHEAVEQVDQRAAQSREADDAASQTSVSPQQHSNTKLVILTVLDGLGERASCRRRSTLGVPLRSCPSQNQEPHLGNKVSAHLQ